MSEPIPVCCALIEQNQKVLVARRPEHKHLGGQWEFPGGKMEGHETPAQALCREIMEELSCTIAIVASLPVVLHAYPNCAIRLHPFVARLTHDSPPPFPREHTALRWLSRDELAHVKLAPADMPIVPAYLQRFA